MEKILLKVKQVQLTGQTGEVVMIGKLRPQIFLAIVVLGILAAIGALKGVPELATATIGGIIALGMKVLENE